MFRDAAGANVDFAHPKRQFLEGKACKKKRTARRRGVKNDQHSKRKSPLVSGRRRVATVAADAWPRFCCRWPKSAKNTRGSNKNDDIRTCEI